jgi:ectoine hydroxylase-related dioxygenase (phytanoyl-CoA dioxygenase family)
MSDTSASASNSASRLDDDAVAAFRRDGYLLPTEPVFSGADFATLVDIFEEDRSRWGDDDLDTIHFRDERLLDFLLSDAVLDLVEPLVGPNIGLWSSHFICKPPRSGKATPWHEDTAYWDGRLSSMENIVTVWLAIDDVDEANGAMRVIPGSHFGDPERRYIPVDERANIFDSELDETSIDTASAVTFELAPGMCSIHDGRIVHGAPANTSDRRRAGYTMRYFPLSSRVVAERNEGHRVWHARGENLGGSDLQYAQPRV